MLAQIAALYPNVSVSVSNKRQAFDLTYNGKLIWNGSSMGPPRALKVYSPKPNRDPLLYSCVLVPRCRTLSHTLQFDILADGALAAAMAKAK